MTVSDKTLQARKLFSSRLRRLLDEHHLNQNELAKVLGVSESTVGKWVLEKSMPRTMGLIQQMADYFGVGKSYFLESKPSSASSDGLPALSVREERDIERDLEDMMQSVASANFATKGAAEDNEALKAALRVAMISAKRAAKKKYTPRKYRK